MFQLQRQETNQRRQDVHYNVHHSKESEAS